MPLLLARFDNSTLSAAPLPDLAADLAADPAADPAIEPPPPELLAWCQAQPEQRLAVQHTAAGAAALEALLRELDGERALQALPSRRRQWALRLGLKLREALDRRRADDPWDCGWLRGDAASLAGFAPRRPTLILASTAQPGCEAVLTARAAGFAYPVRLLIRSV